VVIQHLQSAAQWFIIQKPAYTFVQKAFQLFLVGTLATIAARCNTGSLSMANSTPSDDLYLHAAWTGTTKQSKLFPLGKKGFNMAHDYALKAHFLGQFQEGVLQSLAEEAALQVTLGLKFNLSGDTPSLVTHIRSTPQAKQGRPLREQ